MVDMPITVSLDDAFVRFTPDGSISVLDAIKALTLSDSPEVIWEDLQRIHPELAMNSSSYSFPGEGLLPVLDSKGWEIMWALLFDYVISSGRMDS